MLDGRDRIGGVICTERFDGFTLEHGPDSFITNKPWALDLCNKLGLADQLIETDAGKRRSFVVRNGRLAPVPEGFVLMAPNRLLPILTTPILSFRGKLRLLLDLVIPRRSDESEESLGSFVRRRFGREALDRLVQPLVAGIYTADPYDLSLNATFPQFPAMEREHGSVIRALRREARQRGPRHLEKQASGARYGLFVTLADGMGMLPEALAAALPPGTVHTGTAVRRISRNEPVSPWLVELLGRARRSKPTRSWWQRRPTRRRGSSTPRTRRWPFSSGRFPMPRRSSRMSPTGATRSAIRLMASAPSFPRPSCDRSSRFRS